MKRAVRPGEIMVYIRSSESLGDALRLVPARVFKKSFNTTLQALRTADQLRRKSDHKAASKSEFYVSHLEMGSNLFGISGQPESVNLLHQCARDVYQSEFGRASRSEDLAKAVIKLAEIAGSGFQIVTQFEDGEIPIDDFFLRQSERLFVFMKALKSPVRPRHFSGMAIVSFTGILGEIDYRNDIWSGHLLLNGSSAQIECVFDKAKGEDAYNLLGNKRVYVTGRASYTGESQIPRRLEVISIKKIDPPIFRDIEGTLKAGGFREWSRRH